MVSRKTCVVMIGTALLLAACQKSEAVGPATVNASGTMPEGKPKPQTVGSGKLGNSETRGSASAAKVK